MVAGQGLGKRVVYDVREYVPIGQIMDLRVEHARRHIGPAKSVAELIALAKANPAHCTTRPTAMAVRPTLRPSCS